MDEDVARLRRRIERERAARQEAERIAEENLRILYDRQREIQLVRAAALAANEAHAVTDAMQAALELVCEHSGWPFGHVLLVDERRRLVSSSIWHDRRKRHDDQFVLLKHRTEETIFEPGVGLPGEVLVASGPVWIEDVAAFPHSPRSRGAVVVEDDATSRALLEDLLVADGHSVVSSANGFDALTQLQEGIFDLVVTDRAMPMMSGDELAVLVKGSPHPVPVVMITGFGMTMADAGERPPGVDVVLPKPVTRETLRETLSRIRRKSRPGHERRRGNEDWIND